MSRSSLFKSLHWFLAFQLLLQPLLSFLTFDVAKASGMIEEHQTRFFALTADKNSAVMREKAKLTSIVPLSNSSDFERVLKENRLENTAQIDPDAIIDNGTVQLGINQEGHLNISDGTPSSGEATTNVGLRFMETNAEATAPGCLCEGWGVADKITSVWGGANVAVGGVTNLNVESFLADGTSAISVVNVSNTFRVTHYYHPSPTPNLYQVDVAIENISAASTEAVYRRVMDWDIEPTAFDEYVTLNKGNATSISFTSNDGFASSNPLSPPTDLGYTGSFTDAGPDDHGALFDFNFGLLNPDEVKTFRTYYGAASTEVQALSALSAVNAEAYSLGQPNTADGPTLGTPNTFIFGFSSVGGNPLVDGPFLPDEFLINLINNAKNSMPEDDRFCGLVCIIGGLIYSVGDPVNTRTGALDYPAVDISFPTRAGNLVFQRYYSSSAINVHNTPFGPGWTHNHDTRLIFHDSVNPQPGSQLGEVRFKAHGGSLLIFYDNGNYSYTPYAGVLADLERLADGTFQVTGSDQSVYHFNSNGRLLTWTNPSGDFWAYTYDPISGFLNRVEDTNTGSGLDFAYLNGRLESVTDSIGRSIAYQYDPNGNLWKVTDLRGQTWIYLYEDARFPHHLTKVIDPLSNTVERTEYDAQGRAFRQYDGLDQKTLEIDYSNYQTNGTVTVTNIYGDATVATYDSRGTLADLQNPFGENKGTTFDPNFRPKLIKDENQNELSIVWSVDGANLNSVTDALSQTTSFEYDSLNHLTLFTNPDGTLTKFIYNTPGATDPLTGTVIYNTVWNQNLLLMEIGNFAPGSSAPDTNLVTRYSYTASTDAPEPANMVRKIDGPGADTCYQYNSLGQQTHIYENCVDMDPATGSLDEDILTQYTYDTIGRIETVVDALGYTTRNVYRDDDNLPDEVTRNYDPAKAPYQDGLWNFTSVYVYDSAGRLTDSITNVFDGDLDGNGQLAPALTLDLNNDGTPEYRLEIDPTKPEYNLINHTNYDAAGRVIGTVTNYWPGQPAYHLELYNFSSRFFYDKAGQVVATVANYTEANLLGGGTPTAIDFDGDLVTDANLEINPDYPEYNRISRTSYDKAGRISTSIQAAWPEQPAYYQPAGFNAVYNLVTANEYDAAGNVLKTIVNYDPNWVDSDSDGFSVAVSLDPTGAPVTVIVDPDAPDRNQITCTQYDALNRPLFVRMACVPDQVDYLQVEDNLYNLVTYRIYDQMGRQIASVRNYEDNGVSNSDGVLELTTERNFITRSYYDGLGRVSDTVANFVGDVSSATVPVFDPALPDHNLVTRYDYDSSGRQFAVVGNYWEPAASADGTLTQSEIEAGLPDRNLVTRNYFNTRGQVTHSVQNFVGEITAPALPTFNPANPDRNLITAFVYDPLGRQTETRIERGTDGSRANRSEFDPLGRVSQQIANYVDGVYDPLVTDVDVVTSFTYDLRHRQTGVVDPAGHTQETVYDGLGRVTQTIQDPGGLALVFTTDYDLAGQAVRQTNGDGELTEMRYDPLGRMLSTVEDPPGLALTSDRRYDLLGRVIQVTDAKGLVTRYQYDNLGRLLVVIENFVAGLADSTWPGCMNDSDSVNVCARYTYDDASNRLGVTLGNGSTIAYSYDALGRLLLETMDPYDATSNPDGVNLATAYGYDAAGRRARVTRDPGGPGEKIILYTFDALGGIQQVVYPDSTPDVTYSYDSFHNRVSMVDGTGNWQYAYDQLNHLTAVTDPNNQTVSYDYDPTGSRTNLTLGSSPLSVDYEYDGAGRLDWLTDPFAASALINYSYDGANRLIGVDLPNGVSSAFSYDAAGRLSSLTHATVTQTLGSYSYTPDPLGNRIDQIENLVLPEQANLASGQQLAAAGSEVSLTADSSSEPSVVTKGLFSLASSQTLLADSSQHLAPSAQDQVEASFVRLPLAFVPNVGQSDPAVSFQVQSLGGTLFFNRAETVFVLRNAESAPAENDEERVETRFDILPPSVVRIHYLNANPNPEITGADALPGVVNYLQGNDPASWLSNVPTYAGIVYQALYPGIDLGYEGAEGILKSVFQVAPGADPSVIRWRYNGATDVTLDENGNLLIHLPAPKEGRQGSILIDHAPVAWQDVDGTRVAVPVQFIVHPGGEVRFALPEGYNPTWPLVIDPELTYSTYLGGANNDRGFGITLDPDGNILITGEAVSNNFPTVNPIMGNQPGNDVFVSKLNPDGTSLLYSTYLGGQYSETGHGIALDGAGHIVLVGETESANFPVVNGYQTTHGGGTCPDSEPCDDIFVTQLSADGSTILYSTFLGGNQEDDGLGLALDASGYVYITGYANSSTFPMVNALDSSHGGGTCDSRPCPDAIVAKLDPAATGSASLLYSTFLGAADNDKGQSIAVDSAGHAYVVGTTRSTIPTQTPWQANRAGGRDAFLVKLNPAASGSASKLYGTYLGGSTDDYGYAVALNGVNQVYLAGYTRSTNFPTANAYDNSLAIGTCGSRNCYDAFVAHFNLDNNSLLYSTYLGGTGEEEGSGLAVDSSGSAYLVGYSKSSDFPVVEAVQASKGADSCSTAPCSDAIVTKLSPSGNELVYSTYLGGSSSDLGMAVVVDGEGGTFLTGSTLSSDFPTTAGAYDRTLDTAYTDAFVVKISTPVQPPVGMLPAYHWHYTYDDLNRLSAACSDWDPATSTCLGDNFAYSYDGAGNALSFARWSETGIETVHFIYNSANQIVCQDGNANGQCGDASDIAYSYDAYGNLTNDGVKTYSYDAENRLLSVTEGTSTTSYTYAGDGERVAQTVDGVTTTFVNDTAAPLTQILAETTGTETIYYLHGLDLVAQHDGTTTAYFGYDGLGSVRQLWSSDGSVTFAKVFDPYGNRYADAGIDSTQFGFTGEWTSTNLLYLRARYYSLETGRFLTKDSWQGDYNTPMSYNAWLYVYANPINLSDPTGFRANCSNGVCGPDITEWLMNEMKRHAKYGEEIRNFTAHMQTRALLMLSKKCSITLFDLASETPFTEIVNEFPSNNDPIGKITIENAWSVKPYIEALKVLEFALYGLAVDYSNIDYDHHPRRVGTGNCGSCDFREPTPGGEGIDIHPSVTLCDRCVDSSDIGNMMFGLGGSARGYTLGQTFSFAQTFNILNDFLKPLLKGKPGQITNPFNGDPRGSIAGWWLYHGASNANRTSFCTAISALEWLDYHDNPDQAGQCTACTLDRFLPESGAVPSSFSLHRISNGRPTIPWLRSLMGQ